MKIIVFPIILNLISTIYNRMIEVDDKNFNEVINNNNIVAFLWYNSTDAKSDDIFPEFIEAEILINENHNITFGKIDVNKAKITLDRMKIETFPYFSVFIDGKTFIYDSGYKKIDFITYILYKMNPPIIEFKSVQEIEDFVKNKECALFIGDKDSENFKTFTRAAAIIDDVIFAFCQTEECHFHYDVGYDGIIFTKDLFKIRKELRGKYTDSDIRDLINENKSPVYTKFTLDVSKSVFSEYSAGIFLYRDPNNPEHRRYDSIFKRASKIFKGAIFFVITDIKGDLENQLAFSIRLRESDLPCIYIHDARKEEIKNYRLLDFIDEKSIGTFIIDWGFGRLNRFYKEENPPNEQTYPVETVVRSTFQNIVLDERKKDIFLYFWAPNCPYCENLSKDFEKLASMLNDERLKFCKINAYDNELDINIDGYPTLMLYPAGPKKKPILYSNKERKVSDLIQFLENNLPYQLELNLNENIVEIKDFEDGEAFEVTKEEI